MHDPTSPRTAVPVASHERNLSGLRALINSDAAAIRRRTGRLGPYLFPYFAAVVLYRCSRALRGHGRIRTARVLTWLNQLLTGAELEPLAGIGPGFQLAHTAGIVVGHGVSAGANLTLHGQVLLGSTSGESGSRPTHGFPTLGDDVVVYAKASVIGPVEVGDRVAIGAHALVIRDVPSDSAARGVPAENFPRRPPAAAG